MLAGLAQVDDRLDAFGFQFFEMFEPRLAAGAEVLVDAQEVSDVGQLSWALTDEAITAESKGNNEGFHFAYSSCAFCAFLRHSTISLVADERDKEIVFRPLHESPIVSVHDYCCHIARGGPGAEEESDANNIVLMRHGAFSRHFGRRTVTADVNQAVFFSSESTYRVSHPSDCGDRGTVFTVSPRVLNDIVRELDPSIDEHPD